MEVFKVIPVELYNILISRLTEAEQVKFNWKPNNEGSSNSTSVSSTNVKENLEWIKFEDKFKLQK